uniref:Uncharacterized protein n=1 Tax=Cannabis sativa TaxID=3483 RepID=A0A803QC08_CANSA
MSTRSFKYKLGDTPSKLPCLILPGSGDKLPFLPSEFGKLRKILSLVYLMELLVQEKKILTLQVEEIDTQQEIRDEGTQEDLTYYQLARDRAKMTQKPNQKYNCNIWCEELAYALVTNLEIDNMEPKTYEEAVKGRNSKEWNNAMHEEMGSLKKNRSNGCHHYLSTWRTRKRYMTQLEGYLEKGKENHIYLAFAISTLSKYMSNPEKIHWLTMKWVFRYLARTTKIGLAYKQQKNNTAIEGYSDAGESEYISTIEAIKKAIWMKGLLEEIITEREDNPTDMGTKIVTISKFKHCRNLLGVDTGW